jgi:4-aminobutyrate aminotransferase-like enzyme
MQRFINFRAPTGYEFLSELNRYNYPNVVSGGMTLNRGRDHAGIGPDGQTRELGAQAAADAEQVLLSTTLRRSAPVVHLDLPSAGHYLGAPEGIVFDAYLGVAQRLLDSNHPRYREMVEKLSTSGALLRREAATNDLLVVGSDPSEVVTPQALAKQLTGLAGDAFPDRAPYKAYLCSSGTEAVEAAAKLAFLGAHRRLLEHYGPKVEARLMDFFGIPRLAIEHPEDRESLYADYPYFMISAAGGFHGRTLGSLALSSVRPVNKRGFPSVARVLRIAFNGPGVPHDLIDLRPLDELLAAPDEFRDLLASGRVPRDLVAGMLLEVFQGEAGYRVGERTWINAVVSDCKDLRVPIIIDEIQTFARTGEVFASRHYGLEPDIVAISKASVVGATLASAEFAMLAPLGWHSSTWGGGKIFDNTYAWTTLDIYLNYQDALFTNMTYLENQRTKGEYIKAVFDWLVNRHPRVLREPRGMGGMWGFTVLNRDRVCAAGREIGLKLLTCGITEEWSSIRALFLADVTTKEINCFARLLDQALRATGGPTAT